MRGHSVDSGSTIAKFAKQHFGVELSNDASSDNDSILEEVIANLHSNLSMNIFKNQVIPKKFETKFGYYFSVIVRNKVYS